METKSRALKKCTRCGHEWLSRIEPKFCARCRSPYWRQPRQTVHNRSSNARVARAYVANRDGVERVRITKDGEVHAFGTMPNTIEAGWYLAGFVDELAAQARELAAQARVEGNFD
jgi:hypothetical protein